MAKKRSSSETTGPIRVVLFKGSHKPTTLHLTEKLAIRLYTLLGMLLFLILFLLTLLFVVYTDNIDLKEKNSTYIRENERLRGIIRGTNEPPKEQKPENPDPTAEDEDGTATDDSEGTSGEEEQPVSNEPAENPDPGTSRSLTAVSSGSSSEGNSVLAAGYEQFKLNIADTGTTCSFNYWLVNESTGGARLEGKVVVLLFSDKGILPYPWVPVKDGRPEVTNKGVLCRIQHRRKMSGSVNLPSNDTKIEKARIILYDLQGNLVKEEDLVVNRGDQ